MSILHWLLLGEIAIIAAIGIAVVGVRYAHRYEDDLEYRTWSWRI